METTVCLRQWWAHCIFFFLLFSLKIPGILGSWDLGFTLDYFTGPLSQFETFAHKEICTRESNEQIFDKEADGLITKWLTVG